MKATAPGVVVVVSAVGHGTGVVSPRLTLLVLLLLLLLPLMTVAAAISTTDRRSTIPRAPHKQQQQQQHYRLQNRHRRHPVIPGGVSAHFLEHFQEHHHHRHHHHRHQGGGGGVSAHFLEHSHHHLQEHHRRTSKAQVETSTSSSKSTTPSIDEDKDGHDDDDQLQHSSSSSSSSFYTSPPLQVALDATPSVYRSDEFINTGRRLASSSYPQIQQQDTTTTTTTTTTNKEKRSTTKLTMDEECTPTTCQIIFDPPRRRRPATATATATTSSSKPPADDSLLFSSTTNMDAVDVEVDVPPVVVGVIIYGGAFVDPRSYSRIASTLANDYGIPTLIEIFDNDVAYDVSYIMEALALNTNNAESSDNNVGSDDDGDGGNESSSRSRMCDIYSSGRLELATRTDMISSSFSSSDKPQQEQEQPQQEQEQQQKQNVVKQWVLVGHSLGGVAVMADVWNYYHDHVEEYRRRHYHNSDTDFCEDSEPDADDDELKERKGRQQDNLPLVGGFVLAGTYPRIELGCGVLNFSNVDVPAASVIGSNDGILNMTAYKESKSKYWNTDETFFLNITGGNHEQFGSYDSLERQEHIEGSRQTDGHATIPAIVQQQQFIGAILNVVARVQSRRTSIASSSTTTMAGRSCSSSSTKVKNDQTYDGDGSQGGIVHHDVVGGVEQSNVNEEGNKEDGEKDGGDVDDPSTPNSSNRNNNNTADDSNNWYESTVELFVIACIVIAMSPRFHQLRQFFGFLYQLLLTFIFGERKPTTG